MINSRLELYVKAQIVVKTFVVSRQVLPGIVRFCFSARTKCFEMRLWNGFC